MAKLNFLKSRTTSLGLHRHHASELAPRVGKRYSFQELDLGSFRLSPAIRNVFQLLLFSLGFLAQLYHKAIMLARNPQGKKEEDSESLDLSLPKFKVERHEYFQT